MSYSVFIFDIDNTLTSSLDWHFVESGVESLRKLREKGHTVVISSGRTPQAAVMLKPNGIEYDYFVGANGHMVTDGNDKVLWSTHIDKEVYHKINDYCLKNNVGFFWKLEECSYIVVNNDSIDTIFNTYRSKTVNEEPENCHPFRGALVCSPEDKEKFETVFGKDVDIVDGGAMIYDVNIKGVSKKDGIRELLRIIGKDRDECMAFGDSSNDIEMLEYVGCGIAMGDGRKECREAADYVTDKTYEDGIKKALI